MEKKILLDTDFAKIVYEPDNALAFVTWLKRPTFEEYKQVPSIIVEHAKKFKLTSYMADNTNSGTASKEMKTWWMEEAIPAAAKVSIKKAAVIIDDNPFRVFYMNIMTKHAKHLDLRFKSFNAESHARAWLLSK